MYPTMANQETDRKLERNSSRAKLTEHQDGDHEDEPEQEQFHQQAAQHLNGHHVEATITPQPSQSEGAEERKHLMSFFLKLFFN